MFAVSVLRLSLMFSVFYSVLDVCCFCTAFVFNVLCLCHVVARLFRCLCVSCGLGRRGSVSQTVIVLATMWVHPSLRQVCLYDVS